MRERGENGVIEKRLEKSDLIESLCRERPRVGNSSPLYK